MVHINVTKGLDIPIKGKPEGKLHPVSANGHLVHPRLISLNLTSFDEIKFKILVEVNDVVKVGQPLLEDKSVPGRMFVSPAGGVVREIRRGLKRSLQHIVIEITHPEQYLDIGSLNPQTDSREQIIQKMMQGGLFAHIGKRPFSQLANPSQTPRAIFVKAIESAPFVPPAEMQVEGHEQYFQSGLDALAKLTDGKVHLVYRKGSPSHAFHSAQNVVKHTAEGPHPVGNQSVHIHEIDPIRSPEDVVWTVNVHDVIAIGYLLTTGKYFVDRIIGIGGPGVLPDKTGFFKARAGYYVDDLIAGRVEKGEQLRFISGDVLTGTRVTPESFLGFNHFAFSVIPENVDREFLHFFRLGKNKFTASGAYLSGHLDNKDREYAFTTSQHGEQRAFITGDPYKKVMPMNIPTMELVKSVMAEDFELAEVLGLLEVDSEDFALPAFVDPSKIEMVEIVKQGLRRVAKEA